MRDFAASESTAVWEACGVKRPVLNTSCKGAGAWLRRGERMRVVSRLAGEDFEGGKGCITEDGRVRRAAEKGGLFSITWDLRSLAWRLSVQLWLWLGCCCKVEQQIPETRD